MFENEAAVLTELVRERNLLSPEQFSEMKEEHERTGKPLAQVIVDFGVMDQPQLLQAVADHLNLEFIDLDGFDPTILPSTGTPKPGGLQWYPTLTFIKKLIERRNLVGFDIVELCTNENERSSDFLASKLLYKILS